MATLILHGIENHRPPEHWQFQLAAHLARRGERVLYPDLPDADAPRLAVWERRLRELLPGVHTVVCHSLACLLWFHAAAGITPVERLFLVAPPDSARVPEAGASFRLERFDADAVRASARALTLVGGDDDPYNPHGPALYADPLGIEPRVLRGAGHITPATGYGRWPEAEGWFA